jgi:hypothetical protein
MNDQEPAPSSSPFGNYNLGYGIASGCGTAAIAVLQPGLGTIVVVGLALALIGLVISIAFVGLVPRRRESLGEILRRSRE